MIRLYSTLFAGLVSAAPAFAMQKFEEYRFFGNEIQSVRLGVQEVEDPATLIIDLISGSGAAQQVILESDGGLDDCKQTIDYTIGDASRYIEIRVHTTADTMNGVIVTECTSISAVGY
ncbi:hypothetical protein OEG84_09655 [Hoeflea sp. G2-23]|uniref:Uncharacterized protein n=1 Tax=Hoeflea algicola TaxID=2983763 RepID=A0ABT3Z9N1_9HYPH|nr:hypothetical protein [Hoeflea algicola]MCY0147966.1 hypothetical protein [Hoeflea algicola]